MSEQPRNQFVLSTTFMLGDAVAYTTHTVTLSADYYENDIVRNLFHELIETVKACCEYESNRTHYDYSHIKGYEKFYGNDETQPFWDVFYNHFIVDNSSSDLYHPWNEWGDKPTIFDKFSLYYIDENGDKCNVEIK